MTNQKTPEQGDATEEQTSAITADEWASRTRTGTCSNPRCALTRAHSGPCDPPRGATEEQIEAAALAAEYVNNLGPRSRGEGIGWARAFRAGFAAALSAGEHHDAEEREAESEDHAATVTGDREKLIAGAVTDALNFMWPGATYDGSAWSREGSEVRTIAEYVEVALRGEGR